MFSTSVLGEVQVFFQQHVYNMCVSLGSVLVLGVLGVVCRDLGIEVFHLRAEGFREWRLEFNSLGFRGWAWGF